VTLSLFKYLPQARADFLDTLCLRYSQPVVFNDPFEAKPYFTGIAPEALMEEAYPHRYEKVLREQYAVMSPGFRDRVSFGVFRLELEHTRKSVFDIFRQVDGSFVPTLNEMMHKNFGEKLGVFSLSETKDSQLMWSHYADSHRGFVVEFDCSHAYFADRGVAEDDLWQLKKVIYAEERPRTTVIALDMAAILLTKHISWSYEREWRDFRPLNQASQVIDGKPLSICLYQFPPCSIRSVTIGARADTEIRAKIISAVHDAKSLSHVKLMQAFLDVHDYALTFGNCSDVRLE
jgi:hypothetical protein